MFFENREEAGLLLAEKLDEYRGQSPLILAIPRGAVPMGRIIANKLDGDLDVILVHKIGAPGNFEYAVGAVSEEGDIVLNTDVAKLSISEGYIRLAAEEEVKRLRERRNAYTHLLHPISPTDRVVIIVDDGIATGTTMHAAVLLIKRKNPRQVIVCAPVASSKAVELLQKVADKVVTLDTAELFFSVGQFYKDFRQVSDTEVSRDLDKAIGL